MKVYKRSVFKIILSLIQSIFGGLIVGLLVGYFSGKTNYAIISFAIVEVLLLFMIVSSDRIRFELDGKKFRYYKKNKLVSEYDLENSKIGYHTVTGGNSSKLDLYINDDVIHCEPLGRFKFDEMYNDLEKIVGVDIIKLKVEEKQNEK